MNIQAINSSPPPRTPFDTGAVAHAANPAAASSAAKLAPESPAAPETQAVSQEKLEAAIDNVRQYVTPINNNLEFSIDAETDQVVVKIVDSATREVLRQMPSDEMIAIAKALDSLKGLFVKQRV